MRPKMDIQRNHVTPCSASENGTKAERSLRSSSALEPCQRTCDAFGESLRVRTIGPFAISEHTYPAPMVLPNHAHRQTYITFVIEGAFEERYSSGSMTCRSGSLRFLPAGEPHENHIESRLRCLHVSTDPAVLHELDRHSLVPQAPTEINGLTATWLANRLYAEFSREDQASAIAIEGLVLEIL